MADKRLEVLTRFRADTNGLDRSVNRSALYVQRLNSRVDGVLNAIKRTAGTALGVAGFGGVGYVVVKTAKDVISLNRELETARIGVATVLQQQSAGGKGPFAGWDTALKGANLTLAELEKRAAVLPGTTAEFRRGFELLLPVTSKAGQSVRETMELSERALLAAKVGNVHGGTETVARDIRQILSGSVSIAEISTIALQSRAGELAKLAKKDRGAALREISQVLKVSDRALAAFGQTFEAQASTMQDNITRFVRSAGSPVFEWVKGRLTEWNGWLALNEARVNAIANRVGTGIVKGIKTAADWARSLYDHWDNIKAVIRVLAEVWVSSKLVGGFIKVTAAIKGAGGLAASIRALGPIIKGLLGPIALVTTGFEIMRMMIADPLGDRAKELGLNVIRPGDIRGQITSGKMSADKRAFFERHIGPLKGPGAEQGFARFGDEKRGAGVSRRPAPLTIANASDSQLISAAQAYMTYQQGVVGAIVGPLKSATRAQVGLVERVGKVVSGAAVDVLNAAYEAEKPPSLNIYNSTFKFEQRFEDGDPERVYFEVRAALMRPFIPKLGSTFAPS